MSTSLSQVFMDPVLHYHILSNPALEFPLCFRRIHYTYSGSISVSPVLVTPKLSLHHFQLKCNPLVV